MALVRYIGPYAVVTISGAGVSCAKGATAIVSDEIAASLLTESGDWEAGDEHTAGLTPYNVASLQPVLGFAREPYEAGRTYSAGVLVSEGDGTYLSLRETEGEAPASHPSAWRAIGSGTVTQEQVEAALPPSVQSSRPKVLGEVEGEQAFDFAQGNIFTLTVKGATTIKKPTNAPAGYTEILVLLQQPPAGGKTVTFGAGITPAGGPVNTEPSALSVFSLITEDGGATWHAINAIEGREGTQGMTGTTGTTGSTGATGPQGTQGPAGASGNAVNHGEVSGTVKCSLAGSTFAHLMTVTGNTTIELENWPVGLTEPELYITQDATGGHTVTIAGVTWKDETFQFLTAPNAVNIVPLSSPDGGVHVYGISSKGPRGEGGERGDTGSTGLQGGGSGAYTGLILPYHSGNAKVSNIITFSTAFRAQFCLCLIEKTGHLKKILVPNGGTVAGNTRVCVMDVGLAEAEHYTVLAESGNVTQEGTNRFQAITIPEIAVTAGQIVMLGVMSSATTGTYGGSQTLNNAALTELLAGALGTAFPTAMGAPKMTGIHTFTEMKFTSLTKAAMEVASNTPILLGMIE